MHSKIKKLLNPSFYLFRQKEYKEAYFTDYKFNASFGGSDGIMTKQQKKSLEFKYIKCYRKYQVNVGNIWGYIYRIKLHKLSIITGIDFEDNATFGKGLIIGHWGKIVVNGTTQMGSQIFITHGVTIGRDIRGKRAGVPTIGNRVCIRTNSTIVGNIVIGDDVLIAPNTFVNFDVPSHSVVIGNPASIHHRNQATEGHLGEL